MSADALELKAMELAEIASSLMFLGDSKTRHQAVYNMALRYLREAANMGAEKTELNKKISVQILTQSTDFWNYVASIIDEQFEGEGFYAKELKKIEGEK